MAGLRREEVAELAGISETWYARCEAGRARLSIPALDRIAHVLRLDRTERSRLFALARPDFGLAASAGVDELHGVGAVLDEFRRLARKLSTYSTVTELAEDCARALHGLVGATSLAYFMARTQDGYPFYAACGPGAESLIGYVQPAGTIDHVEPALAAGRLVYESDLSKSASAELRSRVEMMQTWAYAAQTISAQDGVWQHSLGFASFERHVPTALEQHIIGLTAAMLELALAKARGAQLRH